ncbi:alkaline shock response membrane anchor protein AmaP [Actinomadura craniellae]|uniref:Alkaline shock response membrane anchor protein AmaP n=1 Tax=Actinomadura craniellae TaxID=2231787 RepID=A0A365HC30_9ACTN|nr:alkaline shock response membrane anchor protein AmaP [Actinomadura craniellae]RAY15823.1 alkaline shock response membrane anchor protein AmaP [Actinomadura craniellae]
MPAPRRPGDPRRGLTVTGVLLLAVGLAGLGRALGGWGRDRAAAPLLTDEMRRFAAEHAWFWPLVATLVAAVALTGLRWLILQGDADRPARLTLPLPDEGGATRVLTRAAATALESDVAALPGVRWARVRVRGDPDRPRLLISVGYADRADLAELRRHIEREALPRLRTALEPAVPPATVRVHFVD